MPTIKKGDEVTCISESVKHFLSWFKNVGPGVIFSRMDIHKGPQEIQKIIGLAEEFINLPQRLSHGKSSLFRDTLVPKPKV
jgi:hypothetical protein